MKNFLLSSAFLIMATMCSFGQTVSTVPAEGVTTIEAETVVDTIHCINGYLQDNSKTTIGFCLPKSAASFLLDVEKAGYYNLTVSMARAIGNEDGSAFEVSVGDEFQGDVIGDFVTPETGDWGVFVETTIEIQLAAGEQKLWYYNPEDHGGANFDYFKLELTEAVSVQSHASNVSASIYPNPAKDQLFLKTDDFDNGNIIISDLAGKTVLKENVKIVNGVQALNFDLKSGVYTVTITNDTQYKSMKLVVQ